MSTRSTPPRKKLVPLSLCLWKKKADVFLTPMMKERPVRNSSCGEGDGGGGGLAGGRWRRGQDLLGLLGGAIAAG